MPKSKNRSRYAKDSRTVAVVNRKTPRYILRWKNQIDGKVYRFDMREMIGITRPSDHVYLCESLAKTMNDMSFWIGQKKAAERRLSNLEIECAERKGKLWFKATEKVNQTAMGRDWRLVESFYAQIPEAQDNEATIARQKELLTTTKDIVSALQSRVHALRTLIATSSSE